MSNISPNKLIDILKEFKKTNKGKMSPFEMNKGAISYVLSEVYPSFYRWLSADDIVKNEFLAEVIRFCNNSNISVIELYVDNDGKFMNKLFLISLSFDWSNSLMGADYWEKQDNEWQRIVYQ